MLGYFIFAALLTIGKAQITGDGPCVGHYYGDHVPDPKDCTKYYNCVSANEFRMQCPAGLHFDCVTKVCNWPLAAECQLEGETCKGLQITTTTSTTTPGTPTIEAPCTSLDPETHGDPKDCTRYTYCYKGKPTIAKCPIGEFYSKDHNACIEASECPATATTTTTTTTTRPPPVPEVIPPCTSFNPETHPYPDDCKKYIYCESGLPHIAKCAIGEYYSATENACIEASECPATSTTTTSPGSTTPSISTTTSKPTIIAPCTSLEADTKDYPGDCTKYYYCTGGRPHLVQCYPGTYYSEEHRGCIVASQCPGESGGTTPTTTTTTASPIIAPCKSFDPEIWDDPEDCTKYVYCILGYPFVVQCPKGEYYSAAERSCVKTDQCPADVTTTSTTTTTENPIKPPCQSLGVETYPIPENCKQFIFCTNGNPYVVDCEDGYFYDQKANGCVKANYCPSATTTSSTTTTTTTTPTPIQPPCQSLGFETYPIPSDCKKFIFCTNGNPLVVECGDGYFYDQKANGCVKADYCPSGTTTTSTTTPSTTTTTTTPSTTTTTTTPSTTTTTTTSTTTTTTQSPIRPPCTSMNEETHPLPGDCTKYIYCFFGNPLTVQCEKGSYYSAAQKSCIPASQCPQSV